MPTNQATPVRQKKASSRRKKSTRRTFPRYTALTLEISAKILVNLVLLTVVMTALNKLIPNYRIQVSRLEEVKQEVDKTKTRVDELNNEFTRNFDPYQSEIIMQEQTNQIKPNQRRVIWLE